MNVFLEIPSGCFFFSTPSGKGDFIWKAPPESDSLLSFAKVKMNVYLTPSIEYSVASPINLDVEERLMSPPPFALEWDNGCKSLWYNAWHTVGTQNSFPLSFSPSLPLSLPPFFSSSLPSFHSILDLNCHEIKVYKILSEKSSQFTNSLKHIFLLCWNCDMIDSCCWLGVPQDVVVNTVGVRHNFQRGCHQLGKKSQRQLLSMFSLKKKNAMLPAQGRTVWTDEDIDDSQ